VTPYEIDILLWYYTRVSDHPTVAVNPPIWAGTRQDFLNCGLLELDGDRAAYKLTDKGQAYCRHLTEVQIPICKWVQPPTAADKE